MLEPIKQETEQRMKKSVDALERELSTVRTGRAHPGLLDGIQVAYYDQMTPLNRVATVTVEGPQTLLVSPWEKGQVAAIEKAIRASDLGLNPSTSGAVVRVPLPPLTEERRRDLIKHAKAEVETAKVAVRNARRDANQRIKDLLKSKTVTEDQARRAEESIQKLTDRYIQDIDERFARKEAELTQI